MTMKSILQGKFESSFAPLLRKEWFLGAQIVSSMLNLRQLGWFLDILPWTFSLKWMRISWMAMISSQLILWHTFLINHVPWARRAFQCAPHPRWQPSVVTYIGSSCSRIIPLRENKYFLYRGAKNSVPNKSRRASKNPLWLKLLPLASSCGDVAHVWHLSTIIRQPNYPAKEICSLK